MKASNKISTLTKVMLFVAALCMGASIFLPIWQIELYAPQYPEGLELQIYADSLAGDVDIINGLNHYIGMKTLHTEDFIEFSILKYIILFFVLLFIIVALIGRKKPLYILFGLFLFFSVISMVDFYRWNYNYGHDLDPHAAIKVPGMAYQPPLIGYKQLLNFGAYSIPDKGGVLFITAGLLSLLAVLIESGALRRIFRRKKNVVTMMAIFMIPMLSCGEAGPQAIAINKDMCAFCKMTITDDRFAAQLITQKGRHYLFDDLTCMVDFKNENSTLEYKQFYIADFSMPSEFIIADNASLVRSDSLRSPMGGNIAAFKSKDSLEAYLPHLKGQEMSWSKLIDQ